MDWKREKATPTFKSMTCRASTERPSLLGSTLVLVRILRETLEGLNDVLASDGRELGSINLLVASEGHIGLHDVDYLEADVLTFSVVVKPEHQVHASNYL
jgi:hypothetical protein